MLSKISSPSYRSSHPQSLNPASPSGGWSPTRPRPPKVGANSNISTLFSKQRTVSMMHLEQLAAYTPSMMFIFLFNQTLVEPRRGCDSMWLFPNILCRQALQFGSPSNQPSNLSKRVQTRVPRRLRQPRPLWNDNQARRSKSCLRQGFVKLYSSIFNRCLPCHCTRYNHLLEYQICICSGTSAPW
jgi:hypothetical protein